MSDLFGCFLTSDDLGVGSDLDDVLGNNQKCWSSDADTLLESILTGSDVDKLGDLSSELKEEMSDGGLAYDHQDPLMAGEGALEGPFSDTSSDSGHYDQGAQNNKEIDLVDYITNDVSYSATPRPSIASSSSHIRVVSPVTQTTSNIHTVKLENKPIRITTVQQPVTNVNTATTTTIVLPAMNIGANRHTNRQIALQSPPSKRRRVSASSSDSGVDDSASSVSDSAQKSSNPPAAANGRYPPLMLTEEEKRLCEREGIKLPSHYPLSREEEKNLKRIRRKIRNKVSAQDSRKRKKEYVDAMEDRVRKCSDENDQLHKRIEMLETQNKTLAGQLKRLHQIIVNGGLKNSQTSTAMMVLLLSTALFLIPGFKEQSDSKCDMDVTQAIKMPPMPGQSRSLLQFSPIQTEYGTPKINADNNKNNIIIDDVVEEVEVKSKLASDHDYFVMKKNNVVSYIEDDAPPEGYGPGKRGGAKGNDGLRNSDEDLVVERRINVTGKQGMRTVVLHVPRDIK